MSRTLTAPNLLSVARILMTPWIGWAIYARHWSLALPLLFFTGLSDALDGWLARRLRQQSELGARLDPLADKLLLVSVYFALSAAGELPWWLTGLVLGRDLMILGMAAYALRFTHLRSFPPSVWGKVSTFCQLMLAGACVLRRAWPESTLGNLVPGFFVLAVVFTAWSGAHYAWTGWKRLRRQPPARDSASA